jgi:hydrogenase maturation protease
MGSLSSSGRLGLSSDRQLATEESEDVARGLKQRSCQERVLILGLGNLLLGDEGVGVHVVQLLQDQELGSHVEVRDAGTAILDALPSLEQADRVIVIDAVKAGGPPGTVYCMPLAEFRAKRQIASMHGFDLQRVLRLARRKHRPKVFVVGIEPEHIDWSLELSRAVEQALPLVVNAVKQEIEASSRKAVTRSRSGDLGS